MQGPWRAAADFARTLAYLMAWKVLVFLEFYIRKDDSPEPPFLTVTNKDTRVRSLIQMSPQRYIVK